MRDTVAGMRESRPPVSREAAAGAVGRAAASAIEAVVTGAGGQCVQRRLFRTETDSVTVRDVTPADGMIAALALENAARGAGRGYARMAREDGMTWAEIGMLLGLDVGTGDEATAAQTAFTYAAGSRAAADGPRMVAWQCLACRAVISDRGPGDERGHAEDCWRLLAEDEDLGRTRDST